MAHDRDDSTDDDKGDGLADFEAMLREKDKQWTKPPQEMQTLDIFEKPVSDETFEIVPVVDVAENSSEKPKSTETIESTPAPTSSSADVVASDGDDEVKLDEGPMLERGIEIKYHDGPIPYTTETSVAWRYDAEALEIFKKAERIADNIPIEKIIEKIAQMERSVKLIRIAEQGLRSKMARRLSKMRDEDRKHYEGKMGEAAKKNRTMSEVARKRKAPASTGAKTGPKAEKKTKAMVTVDVLKKNGNKKEAVIELVKSIGQLDNLTLAYIEKLTW